MPLERVVGPSLSELIRNAGEEVRSKDPDVPHVYNILEYIEANWGIGIKLFPAQRFIVKLYYHTPLDDKSKTITIPDMFNTKVLYTFTETEYLKYLYNEGRCNIKEQDHERRELLLVVGRRSGKTHLSGIFASYEIYRLLNLFNPQKYYGLPGGNRIQVVSVATDRDQAGLLFNEVTSHLTRCEYFKPYIANNTLSHVQFRTPADIDKFGPTLRGSEGKFLSFNGKATIRVTFKSCVAKGLRGAGNIVIILDEMAHFQDKGQTSATDIYNAVVPSTAAFSRKDPKDSTKPIGPVEARIICISSPLNKSGKFFELYHQAMSAGPGSENMLAIQAPTWEINPTIAPAYYREKYHADPNTFMTEHGAQFSDRVRGWIERERDLNACVDAERRPIEQGKPRFPYQMGIDIGLMGDGSAVAITHAEENKILLDYHEAWYAGISWAESNPHLTGEGTTDYSRHLEGVERLDFDEIADWIIALCKRFYITEGIFDRWNGLPLENALTKAGLSQFKSEFFTRDTSSRMYQAFKLLMYDERLVLYDFPLNVGTAKRSPLIAELLTLQAETLSKNMVSVEAPKGFGYHDDVSDALIRSVWLSNDKIVNGKFIASSPRASEIPRSNGMNSLRYAAQRARSHGVFRERLIHPRNPFGIRR